MPEVKDSDFSEEAQSIAHHAMILVHKNRHSFVDLPHILLALIENSDEPLSLLLDQLGININELSSVTNKTLKQYYRVPRWYRKTFQMKITPFVSHSIEDAIRISEKLGIDKVTQSILFCSIVKNLEEAPVRSHRSWLDYLARSNRTPQRISEEAINILFNYFSTRNITTVQIQEVIKKVIKR